MLFILIMVNNELRLQRQQRISEIVKMLKQVKKSKRELDRKEFIMQICIEFDVQQRKAAEYLRIAEYMIKHKKK